MTLGLMVAVGVLAGLHVATWGAYKDSPFEGFKPASYLRSVLVAPAAALVLGAVHPDRHRHGAVLLTLGVVYAAERLATEWWKAVLREEPQDKYTIPMRLAVAGQPVTSRVARYTVGAGVLVAVAAAVWALTVAGHRLPGVPGWLVIVVVGGSGGWATAIGGAWKDAPIEGFSRWKFLRSPAVATAWAVPLSMLTGDWPMLCLAAAGFAVASIETYKTFLTGGRPPGKFAGRPARYRVPALRRVCGVAHAGLWAAFAVMAAGTLAEEPRRWGAIALHAVGHRVPALLLGSVALTAAALAVLVLHRTRLTGEPS